MTETTSHDEKIAQRSLAALRHLESNPAQYDALIEAIHTMNKVAQTATGESIPELSDHLRQSIKDGVKFKLENPFTTPENQHDNWCKFKTAEGWVYGEVKDFDKKTHPCLVPYGELPVEQQRKDHLFASSLQIALYALGLYDNDFNQG